MKIKREDFKVNCEYASEDGTEDDIYSLFSKIYDYWTYEDDSYITKFSKELVDSACNHVAYLMSIYLYCYEFDEGVVQFDLGKVTMSASDVNENTDTKYKYYFEIQSLVNSDSKLIRNIKEVLNILNIRPDDYYILFLYILFEGELDTVI